MPLILLLLSLVACPSTDDSNPEGPAVDIGTGELEFEPLADGDELAIILGPQGGYHLEGSLRTMGILTGDPRNLLDETNPTMAFGIDHNGGSILLTGEFTQGIEAAPEDAAPWTHQMLGRQARLDLEFGEDDTLDGETVTFSITITDSEGTVVEDSVDVVLFPHPLNGENAPG